MYVHVILSPYWSHCYCQDRKLADLPVVVGSTFFTMTWGKWNPPPPVPRNYPLPCAIFLTKPVLLDIGGHQQWHETQEAKYVESWPNTTSAWAGWSRFDIPVDRYDGVCSLLRRASSTLGSPTCTRLASREILNEQNIKKRTGPALCVLCA
jgi:hypothetical protein